jgi:hypothetical protein
METYPVSEMLKVDKVHKLSNYKCNTPSSETFKTGLIWLRTASSGGPFTAQYRNFGNFS